MPTTAELADAIDRALPQTQCKRCGYPDCSTYARAVADGSAGINQCPPGGQDGIERLARLTDRPAIALNPANGVETSRTVARIEEAACIGCTLCIAACPVDCIVGAAKLMHTVVADQCTGCELCVPACPVDCIVLDIAGPATGWAAWSAAQADSARERYGFRRRRLAREEQERHLPGKVVAPPAAPAASGPGATSAPATAADPRRAAVDAALARARARRVA